jgi:hypothetical protein
LVVFFVFLLFVLLPVASLQPAPMFANGSIDASLHLTKWSRIRHRILHQKKDDVT